MAPAPRLTESPTKENEKIVAAHYYYLLKEDEQERREIWSALTEASPEGAPGLLPELAPGSGRCLVAHRVAGDGVDYCLALLPGLAVIEALYRSDGEAPDRWQAAQKRIDADRDRALTGEVAVFGETTVLVMGESPAEELREAALGIPGGGEALTGAVNPVLTGGGDPKLLALTGHKPGERGYYCLAASAPEEILSLAFPDADAQLKKLDRVATHFGYQRKTIENERAEVDRNVGALLHRQVVAAEEAPEAAVLEEQITSLSRMFGMLATDSLMVRQAAQRMKKDVDQLRQAFAVLFAPGFITVNEIANHYERLFSDDIAAASSEAQNLAFSRKSAQAAIEVVRTQVELLRAGEEAVIQEQTRELLSRSLLLQKERMALQVATGFVEFVLVFYYVLKSWEGIAGYATVEHIAPLWRLLSVGGIAAGAAVGTHFLAQALQRRTARIAGLWLAAVLLVISLAALVLLTVSAG